RSQLRAMSAATTPDNDELSLEPARQTVRAQVEARFTMSAPDLTPKGRHSMGGNGSVTTSTATNSGAPA
ncbi:MAG TPA: hypothetical protein VEJ87_08865, partial [Acidimicrobiales bacterium]|nr:hypothetical protein [Acidimicrobiales bacterium]